MKLGCSDKKNIRASKYPFLYQDFKFCSKLGFPLGTYSVFESISSRSFYGNYFGKKKQGRFINVHGILKLKQHG